MIKNVESVKGKKNNVHLEYFYKNIKWFQKTAYGLKIVKKIVKIAEELKENREKLRKL